MCVFSVECQPSDCLHAVDPGVCNSPRDKWYLSPGRVCTKFTYQGCGGNNNRFDDINFCKCYCLGDCNNATINGKTSLVHS